MFFDKSDGFIETLDNLQELSNWKINNTDVKEEIVDILSIAQNTHKELSKYNLVSLEIQLNNLIESQLDKYIKIYIETGQIDKQKFIHGLQLIRKSIHNISIESIDKRKERFDNIHEFIEIKNKEGR